MKKTFIKRPSDIPRPEQEKIRHEINTFYFKYKSKSRIWHRSVGLDDKYYIYIVDNFGFDDYQMIARIPDWEEE
ncbi:MAG: hypothetical protein J6O73_01485 [Lachnospiraceae bacterium]|nr:hypothetical protein [Lachnospiraceae bacterium]